MGMGGRIDRGYLRSVLDRAFFLGVFCRVGVHGAVSI